MFKPLSLFIGLRYTRAKQRNHFISFISMICILGVALGVAALITVLSVMNGFEKEIKSKLLGMIPHATLYQTSIRPFSHWQTLSNKVMKMDTQIIAVAPFVQGQGMLTHLGQVKGILIEGIDPKLDRKITHLASKQSSDFFTTLEPGEFNIILGEQLAKNLGADIDDKITLVLPDPSVSVIGIMPRFKRFTVSGIFNVDAQFENSIAYIHLKDAARLFYQNDAQVTGLKIKLDNIYSAPRIAQNIQFNLEGRYFVRDWTMEHGTYFEAVKLEKTIMFLMLLLIVAVAAFNIVSALVMVVTDKNAEIAILRTFGASRRFIMKIFMFQGALIGLVGTLLGLAAGVTLALNVTELVEAIENALKIHLLSSDVYYISFLPSDLQWPDVIKVCIISLLMSFIATLYPAWKASKVQPAEALRYE